MSEPNGGATCSYLKNGTKQVIRFYCDMAQHGIDMLGDESQARTERAYYPRRVATKQFSIRALLNGYARYTEFMSWFSAYADYVLDAEQNAQLPPTMTVSVPGRKFVRLGVPLGGITFGDHVGSMLWTPTVTFQAVNDPLEAKVDVKYSTYDQRPTVKDVNTKYFYPFTSQLAGQDGDAKYDDYLPSDEDGGGGFIDDIINGTKNFIDSIVDTVTGQSSSNQAGGQ